VVDPQCKKGSRDRAGSLAARVPALLRYTSPREWDEFGIFKRAIRAPACRIGISNKRFHYDPQNKKVRIEYNDYARQQTGKAAPKKYRDLPPLIAMDKFLQHQTPRYFQRVRHSSPAVALAKEGWSALRHHVCQN
jgi:hypothetical protein